MFTRNRDPKMEKWKVNSEGYCRYKTDSSIVINKCIANRQKTCLFRLCGKYVAYATDLPQSLKRHVSCVYQISTVLYCILIDVSENLDELLPQFSMHN